MSLYFIWGIGEFQNYPSKSAAVVCLGSFVIVLSLQVIKDMVIYIIAHGDHGELLIAAISSDLVA